VSGATQVNISHVFSYFALYTNFQYFGTLYQWRWVWATNESCDYNLMTHSNHLDNEVNSNSEKVKLSLGLTKHHAMNTYWRSEGTVPRILNLGTRCNWVVSFTPWPLYSRYPLDRKLDRSQSPPGRGGPNEKLGTAKGGEFLNQLSDY